MTAIIELNDLELTLYTGGETFYQAPGFAIVREEQLIFGEDALRLARIHPQQANQQYFNRMNADPLPQPIRLAANHADLVYLHLKELAARCTDDAVLAVPGTMSPDQLGILLGICQEAGIAVSGFVNAAVASTTTTAVPEKLLYLDVFLQQIQVSELSADVDIRHERSFEVRDCGFVNLLDGWVNLIADRFVQETRFDPLHTAASEQQLYNQVYEWVLGAHQHNEVPFQVVHNEQLRRVELPRSQLEQKAAQRIERLVDALPAGQSLALTARAARLPGLPEHLRRAGFELTFLQPDAVASGCDEFMSLVRTADTELRLVSRLPRLAGTIAATEQAAPVPTHLLSGHIARPIDSGSLSAAVSLQEDGPWVAAGAGILINGTPVGSTTRLNLGDVVTTESGTSVAIRLEP